MDQQATTGDQKATAEKVYQQGRLYARASGEEARRENLQRAIACYEVALQYYTSEAFPERWQQIQQDIAEAYGELVQERLEETPDRPVRPTPGRLRLTLPQWLLLGLVVVVLLAIPATAIAMNLAHGSVSCVSGTLTIDGSTALQPLVTAAAGDYMQRCPGAVITVGGGASKTGLTDVEQGHNVVVGVDPHKDYGHIVGQDVPIQIGDSDIFASPVQRDLVDHQVAIVVFALIVNRDVTGLHNLNTSQIKGIYTGVYQNWQQICDHGQCGPDLPILPISRTVNSGTRFTFERYILKGVATAPGLGLSRVSSSGNAVQEVENNSGGIGYAPLYLADQAHDVTTLSIDNQDPHNSSLVEHDVYRFWNIEHMYTRGAGSPLAQSFINFMSSDVVSQEISRFGFLHLSNIPQNVRDQHILEGK